MTTRNIPATLILAALTGCNFLSGSPTGTQEGRHYLNLADPVAMCDGDINTFSDPGEVYDMDGTVIGSWVSCNLDGGDSTVDSITMIVRINPDCAGDELTTFNFGASGYDDGVYVDSDASNVTVNPGDTSAQATLSFSGQTFDEVYLGLSPNRDGEYRDTTTGVLCAEYNAVVVGP